MHPVMNQLAQLPASERLVLVQDLWDSINQSREEMPVHEWQRELVKARLADFDEHEEEPGMTREQVWQEVDKRRGL